MIIDAIVTDMDDTLFDATSGVNEYTLNVMRRCTARGIRVIPASGRAPASMLRHMRMLQTGCPYIACNGAHIVSAEHEILDSILIPAADAREICAFLQAEGFFVQTYHDNSVYYAAECEASARYKKHSDIRGYAVGDLIAFVTFPVPKILGIHDPQTVARVLPTLEKRFHNRITVTLSKPHFLEIVAAGVSKGDALRRLSGRMELTAERTLVFGDSLNDVSMFSFTENSVAMGNAREEIRKAARYVCLPNTEDGVARFVQRHVLGEEA